MARSATVDALEKFRFRVTIDGLTNLKLGFHDVQTPKRTTNKISYREGNSPDVSSVSAGLSTMEDVVLSRGLVSYTSSTTFVEFFQWIQLVHPGRSTDASFDLVARTGAADATSRGVMDYRKDVTIELLDREGNPARKWKLYNAFPVQYTPGSDLNAAEDGEKSMEAVTLGYEDFEELVPTEAAPTSIPRI